MRRAAFPTSHTWLDLTFETSEIQHGNNSMRSIGCIEERTADDNFVEVESDHTVRCE